MKKEKMSQYDKTRNREVWTLGSKTLNSRRSGTKFYESWDLPFK